MDEGHRLQGCSLCQGLPHRIPPRKRKKKRRVSIHWWLWGIWGQANPGKSQGVLRTDESFPHRHGRTNYKRRAHVWSDVTVLAVSKTESRITYEMGPWGVWEALSWLL